ncbi:MAG: hypothetical protein V5A36_05870 [Natronomonas sp.]
MASDPVDQLIECGVFEPATGDSELRTTSAFTDAVDEYESTLETSDPEGIRDAVEELTDDPETTAALCQGSEYDATLLSRYVAISERASDLAPAQALALAVLIDQLETGLPRSDGSPEEFFPVRGEDLVNLVSSYERCVVYAWRDDCPSCDVVRSDFDDILAEEQPEDVMFLSVYGPEYAELLENEYDITLAPTTVFTLGGSVDARLLGKPTPEAIEREIETIRERTLPSA